MAYNHQKFLDKKANGNPIAVVTAYDFPTAKMAAGIGIDILLVGDSVGTNVLGYADETEVSMADMQHHCRAVKRGAGDVCVMVDLPYGSAPDPFAAFTNASLLMEAGADFVKVEGWSDQKNTVTHLTEMGIPVCGHIGYNPQYHGSRAKVFGKDTETARELIRAAKTLQDAGAVMLIAEKIPEELCKVIALLLSIPVIGIGSGRFCDGQVLVFHDIAGLTGKVFKHAKMFGDVKTATVKALAAYRDAVVQRTFPEAEHSSHVEDGVVEDALKNES